MEARYMTDLEWRICHAVNIYIFKNGNDIQTPILVHIPPARKKNMQSVMNTIQERVSYPVGYANTLYTMDGKKIRHPCELEMYNNYVVASNFEKQFKCVEYGRKRSPLLILNRFSKHIRVLRLQNENYDQWLRKKREMGSERPQYVFPERYIHEGVFPQDLPVDRMGNTYVPNCDVELEKQGLAKSGIRKGQPQNYTVNAFTTELDPISEYLQHIPPSDANQDHDAKKFKKIGQDQVFYQPQKKWRTKGVVDKNRDKNSPLFARASDVANANLPCVKEEEIEDIAEWEDTIDYELLDDVDEVDEYHNLHDNISSTPQEKKILPVNKRKKPISFVQKKNARKVGEPYKIVRPAKLRTMREKNTQTVPTSTATASGSIPSSPEFQSSTRHIKNKENKRVLYRNIEESLPNKNNSKREHRMKKTRSNHTIGTPRVGTFSIKSEMNSEGQRENEKISEVKASFTDTRSPSPLQKESISVENNERLVAHEQQIKDESVNTNTLNYPFQTPIIPLEQGMQNKVGSSSEQSKPTYHLFVIQQPQNSTDADPKPKQVQGLGQGVVQLIPMNLPQQNQDSPLCFSVAASSNNSNWVQLLGNTNKVQGNNDQGMQTFESNTAQPQNTTQFSPTNANFLQAFANNVTSNNNGPAFGNNNAQIHLLSSNSNHPLQFSSVNSNTSCIQQSGSCNSIQGNNEMRFENNNIPIQQIRVQDGSNRNPPQPIYYPNVPQFGQNYVQTQQQQPNIPFQNNNQVQISQNSQQQTPANFRPGLLSQQKSQNLNYISNDRRTPVALRKKSSDVSTQISRSNRSSKHRIKEERKVNLEILGETTDDYSSTPATPITAQRFMSSRTTPYLMHIPHIFLPPVVKRKKSSDASTQVSNKHRNTSKTRRNTDANDGNLLNPKHLFQNKHQQARMQSSEASPPTPDQLPRFVSKSSKTSPYLTNILNILLPPVVPKKSSSNVSGSTSRIRKETESYTNIHDLKLPFQSHDQRQRMQSSGASPSPNPGKRNTLSRSSPYLTNIPKILRPRVITRNNSKSSTQVIRQSSKGQSRQQPEGSINHLGQQQHFEKISSAMLVEQVLKNGHELRHPPSCPQSSSSYPESRQSQAQRTSSNFTQIFIPPAPEQYHISRTSSKNVINYKQCDESRVTRAK